MFQFVAHQVELFVSSVAAHRRQGAQGKGPILTRLFFLSSRTTGNAVRQDFQ